MMKYSAPLRRRLSGVVLLVALAALAIMMVLLLALFEGVSMQSRGALDGAIVAREKMLADSAAELVIGQIGQASTQTGQTWISQPGLVRTYNAMASRAPTACYKLYSTTTLAAMTDTSGTVGFLNTDVPSNWSAQPDLYTDLNAPAQTSTGTSTYPILDPSAATFVQGINIDAPHSVEMPVAWLYQLQDGTLGPAGNGTASNPIVARIAFWTDDDTCKININTAGCGSPWNTPRVNSGTDIAWSTHQPAQGEFSACPGHPATTSLNVVFGSIPLSPQQLLGLTPRYAWGGSQFGAQPTTPGETVPMKTDRLYASLDELQFSSSLTGSNQRAANPITAAQLNAARFVLTAHSVAPETTMLGEPRVAIWPVADSASATTATDRAIASAATVGTRDYYFQRNNPLNPLDDFDPNSTSTATTSNLQLFGDLVNRGSVSVPGCSGTFAAKYPGAAWTQIMLECADFIHQLNSVDPIGAPFAPANSNGIGRGFVVPLTTTCGTGASAIPLRGIGRCPTLSSLTIVFYVCGFGFKNGTFIDYDATPDDPVGDNWNINFVNPATSQWKNVTSELVRAFIVPCTFQPGCAYPEVSDACEIQIQGLNGITVSSGSKSGGFGFPAVATSLPLGTPLVKSPAERAWGGNEGPLAWRVAADALAAGGTQPYAFASPVQPVGSSTSTAFALPMTTTSSTLLNPQTGGGGWPPVGTLNFAGLSGVKVLITDLQSNTLQTFTLNLPPFSPSAPYAAHAPTINGECDHADALPPAASISNWATNSACAVPPSWYMTLNHRLLTSSNSRAVMIQAGDISRSVEAATDLRVIAGLSSVPSAMFHMHHGYQLNSVNGQGGTHAHNLRFADGTSACFAPGNSVSSTDPTPANAAYAQTSLVKSAAYISAPAFLLTVPPWHTGTNPAYYNLFGGPPCSAPTGTQGAVMTTNVNGDWDTGPGYAPDGAQINLPDEGTSLDPATAYQSLTGGQVGAATQRTPNAPVPSPVIFGSLPAGINPADSLLAANNPSGTPQSIPWRTLLFCPYPAANTSGVPYTTHPGAASPPDYLLLDNFWMPVVEPYAISTCMATRGKINLNDQIAPFTWIHRHTALRALLDDLRIPAIPATGASLYKSSGIGLTSSIWNSVDEDDTVTQIESRFTSGGSDAYLSESEICAVPLVPSPTPGETWTLDTSSVAAAQASLGTFWSSAGEGQLTGDNLRELPYAQLYGRLTTRSNSYTVHVRVQVLKKLPRDPDQNVWKDASDLVLGEWRGSYEIERYLDPAATAPAAGSPLGPYKFRIVSKSRFAP
jgi:uncharacterized protein (TIGR02600 family)